jgi:hypothetical protein
MSEEKFYYAYAKDFQTGYYDEIDIVAESNLKEWLIYEGIEYDRLKLVKNDGRYMELSAIGDTDWDVIDRGIEDISLHEKKSFRDFSKSETKMDRTINRATKDKPLDQRKHHLKAVRGAERKNQNQIPKYRQIQHNGALPTAENVLKNAKAATSGAWKLSPRQVGEIAGKYKFNVPTGKKKTKHLGSTGILMWRKTEHEFYLVKFSKHHKDARKAPRRHIRK